MLGKLEDVQRLVTPAVFKRGIEVKNQNKLHNVELQGDDFLVGNASCSGSKPGETYSLQFKLEEGKKNPQAQCSCPAAASSRGLCKHTVAFLLLRVQELSRNHDNKTGDVVNKEQEKAMETESEVLEVSKVQDCYNDPNPMNDSIISAKDQTAEPKNPNECQVTVTGRVLPAWMTSQVVGKRKTNKKQGLDSNGNIALPSDKVKINARKGRSTATPAFPKSRKRPVRKRNAAKLMDSEEADEIDDDSSAVVSDDDAEGSEEQEVEGNDERMEGNVRLRRSRRRQAPIQPLELKVEKKKVRLKAAKCIADMADGKRNDVFAATGQDDGVKVNSMVRYEAVFDLKGFDLEAISL